MKIILISRLRLMQSFVKKITGLWNGEPNLVHHESPSSLERTKSFIGIIPEKFSTNEQNLPSTPESQPKEQLILPGEELKVQVDNTDCKKDNTDKSDSSKMNSNPSSPFVTPKKSVTDPLVPPAPKKKKLENGHGVRMMQVQRLEDKLELVEDKKEKKEPRRSKRKRNTTRRYGYQR